MNAAKAAGLEVGPTRPLSRAERRAQASRVQAEQEAPLAAETAVQAPETPRAVRLQPQRSSPKKGPFATQLRQSTLGRIEWLRTHGYVITTTVDDAINAYLDAAGIPAADENGTILDQP